MNDLELSGLRQMFGLPADDRQACSTLLDRFDIELIGLTLGENGAFLFNKKGSDYYKPRIVEIVDTLGAGDAFAAILCLGYLNNLPLQQTNKLANEFAGAICKVNGALPQDNSLYQKYGLLFTAI
jgi:fructokinase